MQETLKQLQAEAIQKIEAAADLKQLNDNEKNIEVIADNDTLTIKGVAERNRGKNSMMIDFSQTL